MRTTHDSIDVCTECGNRNIIRDDDGGEYVCGDCGMVIGEILDTGPEWRAFDSRQRATRPRTGAPITQLIHDKGMSTVIDYKDRDYSGRRINPEQRLRMRILRKWDRKSKIKDSWERSLTHALGIIGAVSDELHLPKHTIEEACRFYRELGKNKTIRGRSISDIAPACIYLATRTSSESKIKRSLDQITEACGIDRDAVGFKIKKKAIARTYRYVLRALNTKPPLEMPSDVLSGIVGNLKLEPYVEDVAYFLAQYVEENTDLTAGRDPRSIACAITYIAGLLTKEITGYTHRQTLIASAAGKTEVTLRNRYNELTTEAFKIEKNDWYNMANIMNILYENGDKEGKGITLEDLKKEYNGENLSKCLEILDNISIINKTSENGSEFYTLDLKIT